MKLSKSNILIIGQVKTSRTETVEDYLKGRTKYLGVIGLMGPYATRKEARCTLYHKGEKIKEFPLFGFSIKKLNRWKYPLITISFSLYIFSILYAVLRLGKKFDIGITIATASSLIGLTVLRPLGIVKHVIFYCIDYYPPGVNYLGDFLSFQKIFHFFYTQIDIYLVKYVDITWELSPRIEEGRKKYTPLNINYNKIIVPLGYSEEFCNKCQRYNKHINARERWTLGFIGVLSPWQGLAMVIEAMPHLLQKFPDIKVRIVGDGPFSENLKDLVKKKGLGDQFIFHGFIQNEEKTYDILSRCIVGLATWTGDSTDYSQYADPGKPKLYALLGLPVIITSVPFVSKSIADTGAGEVIEYDASQFISKVEKMISNDIDLKNYITGVERFKHYCYAKDIFDKAFKDTFKIWNLIK